MNAERAIEIGNIFKLGSRYSETMGATYLDAEGQSRTDRDGLIRHRLRPRGRDDRRAAPRRKGHDLAGRCRAVRRLAALARRPADDAETAGAADKLYAGTDRRRASRCSTTTAPTAPGVKFNDADLIGNPIRLSVSPRTLENGQAEIKARKESEATFVPLDEVIPAVRAKLEQLRASEQTYPVTR